MRKSTEECERKGEYLKNSWHSYRVFANTGQYGGALDNTGEYGGARESLEEYGGVLQTTIELREITEEYGRIHQNVGSTFDHVFK